MASPASSLSPALMAANQRLLQLREQLQANKQDSHLNTSDDDSLPWQQDVEGQITAVPFITDLPPHLGWESEAFTQTLRQSQQRKEREEAKRKPLVAEKLVKKTTNHQPTQLPAPQTPRNTVKHYPSIGIAALKAEQAPIYRVWLMCRYLDVQGRGWHEIEDVRDQLTDTESRLRLFTWRRLRQILGKGHEQFWTWDRDNGRLWLFGAARTAAHLEVERLTGKPVALPISAITESIGTFKAHLYGAWHSGRKRNNPISRTVQENITGIPERTQRHYCKVAKVERRSNIAIGRKHTPENAKETAWQHSWAVFDFIDSQGKQGRKGTHYLAWHLPNSYAGPHQQSPKGRMRKINRKLVDLVTKGARGNDSETVEKLYFANGKVARQAFNLDIKKEKYWFVSIATKRHHIWSSFLIT